MILHSVLVLFFILLICGVFLFAIRRFPGIDETVRQYIVLAMYVVIALVVIFWVFGLFGIGPGLSFGNAGGSCRGRLC